MGHDRSLVRDEDRYDDPWLDAAEREPIRGASRPERRRPGATRASHRELRASRRPETDAFRCRHCRAMVGPSINGGRHRNHCPYCLHSRHVDERRPGDRASACRATMRPIGVFARRSGEQVLVHRCLGCGVERWNRIAADDDPVALMRLPLLEREDQGTSTAAAEG